MHFLVATGPCDEWSIVSVAPESTVKFFFFLIFLFDGFDTVSVKSVSEPDSKDAEGWDILGLEEKKRNPEFLVEVWLAWA